MNTKSNTIKNFLPYLLAATISIITSLILIIIFAITIKWFSLSDAVITPVNMAIKGISLLFGLIYLLKDKHNGLVKGIILGCTYFVASFLLFSVLAGTFNVGVGLLIDFIYIILISSLLGIILVNIKK